MDGSATPTMDTSSASRQSAQPKTMSTPHSRGVHRWAALAGSAKAPEAGPAARGAAGRDGARDGARDEAGVGSVIGDGRCRSGDRMTSTLCMCKQYLQAQLMY